MAQVTMYPGMVNSPETVLTRAADEAATELYLADVSKIPAAPNIVTLGLGEDAETVSYALDPVAGVLTVVRGVQGTARPWAFGTKVARRITEMDVGALQTNVADHESRMGSVVASLDDLTDVVITDSSPGDVIVGGALSYVNLPAGVAGKVLTTHGAGSAPTWETPAAGVSQVTPAAITIAHATTDAAAGKTATIDLTANHGMLTRLRFRADYISGQQGAWSGLVNAANGYAPADTSIAFDGGVGTLTGGKYVKWGEEICLVGGSGTITTPMTLTRAQKGTTATYHPDNEQIVLLNDGVRLEFYPNSNYLPSERLFVWDQIMTGKWVTAAAISANATALYTTTDPTVVSDFGFDSLILIDPAGTPEYKRIASVHGDVANNTYDKAVFVQGALAAHDNTKDVFRLHQFDVPIPVKFATSATTLYVKMFVDEAITGTVTGTLEVIADKWS